MCGTTGSALLRNADAQGVLFSFIFEIPPERKLEGPALTSQPHLAEKYEELCGSCVCPHAKNPGLGHLFFHCAIGVGPGALSSYVLEVNNSGESHGLTRCLLGKQFTHSKRGQTRSS